MNYVFVSLFELIEVYSLPLHQIWYWYLPSGWWRLMLPYAKKSILREKRHHKRKGSPPLRIMTARNRAMSLSSSSSVLNLTENSNLGSIIWPKGFLRLLRNSRVMKICPYDMRVPSLFIRGAIMMIKISITPYFSKVTCKRQERTDVMRRIVTYLTVNSKTISEVYERRRVEKIYDASHLVVEIQVNKSWDTFGKLSHFSHCFSWPRLTAVEETQLHSIENATVGVWEHPRGTWNQVTRKNIKS